ncbi:NAD-dependent epimerase/dehydratase family protein [Lacisediminihabitans profunda]|uniref:NAD-dependent epimerase/dehydratase family protein n=1 Tax=Lacisediminihabitans profunda TaxID=2594790 RepID=A0A5C8UK87_9MICO|nr:NAD-dependent epimerase/dehydratase family protein [Lacisediminihabitans profunda]TXN28217.1 NAD-dependent epimerase/dehydratase family protein [Lacisediminihabitans profunda]
MKVLITGGAGFIGSNLARHFLRHDPTGEVRILDDLSTGRIENLDGLDVDFVKGSILDYDLLVATTAGVDSVVHLAALGSVPRSIAAPRPTHETNITGTLNVLEAARETGIDHVVVASSSSVYGSNLALPKSEFDWTRPMSPYATSKLATESYAIAYNFSFGLKTLAFRFFNVYGPRQFADHVYAAVIPKFIDAALNDRPLVIHGDGLQSRDFTYVGTVCAALFDAVSRKVTSKDPVNLAFGTNTPLIELIQAIESTLGVPARVQHVETRAGDVRASRSDGIRMRELFPTVGPTALGVGLRETAAWFTQSRS